MSFAVYFRIVLCYLGFLIDYEATDKIASVNQTEPEEDYESVITRMYFQSTTPLSMMHLVP